MNNFREWLSDNLRYILLILVILAALLGIFFGVRALSRTFGDTQKNDFDKDSIVTSTSEAASSETAGMSEVTSSLPESEVGGALMKESVPAVTELVHSYFDAVERKDTNAAAGLVDTLPDDEMTRIKTSGIAYQDLTVYTKKGPEEGCYIVYAYFHYTSGSSTEVLPGLSQMLVKKADDGTEKIIFGDYDKATAEYINKVSADEDVKKLVADVRAESAEVTIAGADSAASTAESSASSQASGASVTETPEATPTPTSTPEPTAAPEPTVTPTATPKPEPTVTAAPEPTEEPKKTKEPSKSKSALLKDCFLRSGPGYQYKVIKTVHAGDAVTILEDSSETGWWHIVADGTEGYVGKWFIN